MAPRSMSEYDELVVAYWEHYRLFTSEVRAERLTADAAQWAVFDVDEITSDEDRAVPLIVALAEGAPDEQALAYLGAGPIENAVLTGSDILIDRIEGAAERNEKFRLALRCAWFDDSVPPSTRIRLRRFGPPV